MLIHSSVLLTISDLYENGQRPIRMTGPLFGRNDEVLACAKADESTSVADTLDLLRRTHSQLHLVGWFYVGFGLVPNLVRAPTADSLLLLIDVPSQSIATTRAFEGGNSWTETSLQLSNSAPSQIALEAAIERSSLHDERRAKLALRDRIRALREQLKSDNDEDVAQAVYKHFMLKKLYQLHNDRQSSDNEFLYELLTEVIAKADSAHLRLRS